MLSWAGCHVDSLEQARWFDDDHRAKAEIRLVDLGDEQAAQDFIARQVGAGQPWPQRRRTIAACPGDGVRDTDAMFENHRRAVAALAEALDVPVRFCAGLDQVYERWDGAGEPLGLRGAEASFSARAANLGDVVMAIHRAGGADAAVAVARARRGTQFDPDLVDAFCDEAEAILGALDAVEAFDATMRLCPGLDDLLDDEALDRALRVLADYVDLKSPTTLGHQSATADLVDAAADDLGLGTRERRGVRRAACCTTWAGWGFRPPSGSRRVRTRRRSRSRSGSIPTSRRRSSIPSRGCGRTDASPASITSASTVRDIRAGSRPPS